MTEGMRFIIMSLKINEEILLQALENFDTAHLVLGIDKITFTHIINTASKIDKHEP